MAFYPSFIQRPFSANGGAISAIDCVGIYLHDVDFSSNEASGLCGSLYTTRVNATLTLYIVINASKFHSNTAFISGGAIHMELIGR